MRIKIKSDNNTGELLDIEGALGGDPLAIVRLDNGETVKVDAAEIEYIG